MAVRQVALAALLPCFAVLGLAQTSSATSPKKQVVKPLEDAIAKAFKQQRAALGLPAMTRIGPTRIRQEVCTASLRGTLPADLQGESSHAAIYRPLGISELTPQLIKVAGYQKAWPTTPNSPQFTRFAVAVWPAARAIEGQGDWIAGVEVYWSAGSTFFEYYLTDTIFYGGPSLLKRWKTHIAPECVNVK